MEADVIAGYARQMREAVDELITATIRIEREEREGNQPGLIFALEEAEWAINQLSYLCWLATLVSERKGHD
jgi:hypothetical protein